MWARGGRRRPFQTDVGTHTNNDVVSLSLALWAILSLFCVIVPHGSIMHARSTAVAHLCPSRASYGQSFLRFRNTRLSRPFIIAAPSDFRRDSAFLACRYVTTSSASDSKVCSAVPPHHPTFREAGRMANVPSTAVDQPPPGPVDILLVGLGSIGSIYAYLLERVGFSSKIIRQLADEIPSYSTIRPFHYHSSLGRLA